MRSRPILAATLVVCVLSSCRRSSNGGATRSPAGPPLRGRVVATSISSLTIQLPPTTDGDRERHITIDPTATKVTAETVELDPKTHRLRVVREPARLSDLRVGDVTSILTRRELAISITIGAPQPIEGQLVGLGPNYISIHPWHAAAASQGLRFHLEKSRIAVVAQTEAGDFQPSEFEALRLGDLVSLVATREEARLIGIVPPPPFPGKVRAIRDGAITIQPTTRPGEMAATDQQFQIDPKETQFFEMYLGLAPERATFPDLQIGESVDVYARDGKASKVTIVHSPIHRKLVMIGDKWIMVNRRSDLPNERLAITPSTDVLLSKVTNSFRGPDGRVRYAYTYVGGHKVSELNPGDNLSITAKKGTAMQIRVLLRQSTE